MALIDAPAYDASRDNLKRNILIAALAVVVLAVALGIGGFVAGHGWFFTNLSAEHKVSSFLEALEAKDYAKAYNIYNNGQADPNYTVQRFTEDWTDPKLSPAKGAVTSHVIEISKTEGTGNFGTGVIVAAKLNNLATCAFIRVDRKSGTLTWPAFHEIGYDKCNNT